MVAGGAEEGREEPLQTEERRATSGENELENGGLPLSARGFQRARAGPLRAVRAVPRHARRDRPEARRARRARSPAREIFEPPHDPPRAVRIVQPSHVHCRPTVRRLAPRASGARRTRRELPTATAAVPHSAPFRPRPAPTPLPGPPPARPARGAGGRRRTPRRETPERLVAAAPRCPVLRMFSCAFRRTARSRRRGARRRRCARIPDSPAPSPRSPPPPLPQPRPPARLWRSAPHAPSRSLARRTRRGAQRRRPRSAHPIGAARGYSRLVTARRRAGPDAAIARARVFLRSPGPPGGRAARARARRPRRPRRRVRRSDRVASDGLAALAAVVASTTVDRRAGECVCPLWEAGMREPKRPLPTDRRGARGRPRRGGRGRLPPPRAKGAARLPTPRGAGTGVRPGLPRGRPARGDEPRAGARRSSNSRLFRLPLRLTSQRGLSRAARPEIPPRPSPHRSASAPTMRPSSRGFAAWACLLVLVAVPAHVAASTINYEDILSSASAGIARGARGRTRGASACRRARACPERRTGEAGRVAGSGRRRGNGVPSGGARGPQRKRWGGRREVRKGSAGSGREARGADGGMGGWGGGRGPARPCGSSARRVGVPQPASDSCLSPSTTCTPVSRVLGSRSPMRTGRNPPARACAACPRSCPRPGPPPLPPRLVPASPLPFPPPSTRPQRPSPPPLPFSRLRPLPLAVQR